MDILNLLKNKVLDLLKANSSFLKFLIDYFTKDTDDLSVQYINCNTCDNNLNNYNLQTLTEIQSLPYRIKKIKTGYVKKWNFLEKTTITIFDNSTGKFYGGYFPVSRTRNKKYVILSDNSPLHILDTRKSNIEIYFRTDIDLNVSQVVPVTTLPETGGIKSRDLFHYFYVNAINLSLNHLSFNDINSLYLERDNPNNDKNYIIKYILGSPNKFVFKNYFTNQILDCNILDKNNYIIIERLPVLYRVDRNNYRYNFIPKDSNDEYFFDLLFTPDIVLGIKKYYSSYLRAGIYSDGISKRTIEIPFLRDTSYNIESSESDSVIYNYNSSNRILSYYEDFDYEYTKTSVKINNIIYTRNEFKEKLVIIHNLHPIITYHFPNIHYKNKIYIDDVADGELSSYTFSNVSFFSQLYDYFATMDEQKTGKVRISNNSLFVSSSGGSIYNQINTNSIECIYAIAIIVDSVPIIFAPYFLTDTGKNSVYENVISNIYNINEIKNKINYANSKLIPIFYNGYKIPFAQEVTLYGKRYPFEKDALTFALLLLKEVTYNGKKYLLPIPFYDYSGWSNYMQQLDDNKLFNLYNIMNEQERMHSDRIFLILNEDGRFRNFIRFLVNTQAEDNQSQIPYAYLGIRAHIEWYPVIRTLNIDELFTNT